MLSDPEAEMGVGNLPVMLTPPLPANENSPLATTGGGSSVRLGALPIAQIPSRHTKHMTLTARLFRMVNRTRATHSNGASANPSQSPLRSNVAGEAYVNSPLPAWPHGSVTTTSTVPAAWAGIENK